MASNSYGRLCLSVAYPYVLVTAPPVMIIVETVRVLTIQCTIFSGYPFSVHVCILACMVQAMLEKAGIKTMLNELSSTVVFERPLEERFVKKWQLACQGDIAHVVVMPNITLDKLEVFVQDLIQSRARVSVAAMKQIAADARAADPNADA